MSASFCPNARMAFLQLILHRPSPELLGRFVTIFRFCCSSVFPLSPSPVPTRSALMIRLPALLNRYLMDFVPVLRGPCFMVCAVDWDRGPRSRAVRRCSGANVAPVNLQSFVGFIRSEYFPSRAALFLSPWLIAFWNLDCVCVWVKIYVRAITRQQGNGN